MSVITDWNRVKIVTLVLRRQVRSQTGAGESGPAERRRIVANGDGDPNDLVPAVRALLPESRSRADIPGGLMRDQTRGKGNRTSDEVLDHFDIVGFDPRGVGASEPAFACGAPGERLALLATIDLPIDTDSEVAAGEAAANLCIESMGPVGGLLHSEYVARDMDEIRKALGADRISYLGFSYGSTLGVWYATLFPGSVRAMVVGRGRQSGRRSQHAAGTAGRDHRGDCPLRGLARPGAGGLLRPELPDLQRRRPRRRLRDGRGQAGAGQPGRRQQSPGGTAGSDHHPLQ